MRPLKKIYCRVFQGVFRLALPVLPYRNPEILRRLGDVPPRLKKRTSAAS